MAQKPKPKGPNVETTGHSWDGIEELNNPLPRWWLWTFYGTIAWGLVYTIMFPAWPLISGATPGVSGFSTRQQVAEEIAEARAANAPLDQAVVDTPLTQLADNADLHRYAVSGGAAVFRTNCAQCHGSGAAGAVGFPNLLDDDWLWGGGIEEIAFTVRHGVRNETDPEARYSQMPAFGQILSDEEIEQVVAYVRTLAGNEAAAELAGPGAEVFATNCVACHGEDGTGDRVQGAPNLTDAIWLYGGDVETLTQTVTNSRFGVMPEWGDRLTEAQIRSVAAYVHQLGGGE